LFTRHLPSKAPSTCHTLCRPSYTSKRSISICRQFRSVPVAGKAGRGSKAGRLPAQAPMAAQGSAFGNALSAVSDLGHAAAAQLLSGQWTTPLLIAGVTTLGLWRLAQFIRCFCTALNAWLVLACLHVLSLVPYQYVTGTHARRGHLRRADADLGLLRTRRLPPDAFKDKLVWVTGASQARRPLCQPARCAGCSRQRRATLGWATGPGRGAGAGLCSARRTPHTLRPQHRAPAGALAAPGADTDVLAESLHLPQRLNPNWRRLHRMPACLICCP